MQRERERTRDWEEEMRSKEEKGRMGKERTRERTSERASDGPLSGPRFVENREVRGDALPSLPISFLQVIFLSLSSIPSVAAAAASVHLSPRPSRVRVVKTASVANVIFRRRRCHAALIEGWPRRG